MGIFLGGNTMCMGVGAHGSRRAPTDHITSIVETGKDILFFLNQLDGDTNSGVLRFVGHCFVGFDAGASDRHEDVLK